MIPTQDLYQLMVEGIGATTTSFTPSVADPCWLIPIKVAFTPGLGLTLTFATDAADFDGADPLPITGAARDFQLDPLTGSLFLNMPPPAGGFHWNCGTDPVPPQTIFGVALSNDSTTFAGGALLASALLDEPVTITSAGDAFDFGPARFTFNPAFVS